MTAMRGSGPLTGFLLALGLGSSLLSMLWWYLLQYSLALYPGATEPIRRLALAFAFSFAASLACFAMGLALLYGWLALPAKRSQLLFGLSVALSDARSLRAAKAGALLYSIAYAFFTGLVVFRPGVDFGSAYGFRGPSWLATPCCGPIGAVPIFVVAIPSLYIGFVITPMNLLLLSVLAFLVGLNAATLAHTLSLFPRGSGWLSIAGAALGLAAGCPSCSALLASALLGGVGLFASLATGPGLVTLILASTAPLVLSPLLAARATSRRLSCSR
jgi:hypothetical protein